MMDEPESRFSHLLQPIRDLTKNWEVDVAAQLGEYLDELDQICISFDGGKTTMNFAEAALLIQGSACIYSKKVEYLYSMVYQALDCISNKKRNQQPTSIGQDGVDNDASFVNRNEEEEFLSLDDICNKIKGNVDMKNDRSTNAVEIVPLTPMALVPPEEQEKKNNPLYSRKGEILASCKDFRMNTYTPHVNGAYVLELAGLSPTQLMLRDLHFNNLNCSVLNAVPMEEVANPHIDSSSHDCPLPVLDLSAASGNDNGLNDTAVDRSFLPLAQDVEMNMDTSPQEHIETQKVQTTRDRYLLREQPLVLNKEKIEKVQEVIDPWKSLDPFTSSEDKPFRNGKYFTIPKNIEETAGGKRKRKAPTKFQDFRKFFSGTFCEVSDIRKNKKNGPTFADMEILYWKHMKERFKGKKRMGILFSNENGGVENNFDNEHENDIEALRHGDYPDVEEDSFSNHEDEDANDPMSIVHEQEILSDEIREERLSYEDLVQRNVELFIANSQKYAQETALSVRIKEWEDQMRPLLTEQEERIPFDIHDYGNKIVDAFNHVGERKLFASIVRDKEAFEVCRYMLASLQLANDYTVQIDQKPGLHEALDTMGLKLLSQQRAHERFKTYTAPSLSDN
ncbi:condensin-2 complex subunit H2 [Polypterus senegalus]|uniref:condensin-2 complex subunit H2 n=1 Tax=Polypterus senegalus TaxID=55291 RepID=UPI001965049F|nr:condensin-2 complex subunit H2 [Polypterus senegalus]